MAPKRRPLSDAPDSLEPDQRERIRVWVAEHYPFLRNRKIYEEWEKCRDWHKSNGVLRACWEATFRNWLRMAPQYSKGFPAQPAVELGQVLPLFKDMA